MNFVECQIKNYGYCYMMGFFFQFSVSLFSLSYETCRPKDWFLLELKKFHIRIIIRGHNVAAQNGTVFLSLNG